MQETVDASLFHASRTKRQNHAFRNHFPTPPLSGGRRKMMENNEVHSNIARTVLSASLDEKKRNHEKLEKSTNFGDLVKNGGRHPSDDVETIQMLRSRVLGTKISLFSVNFRF